MKLLISTTEQNFDHACKELRDAFMRNLGGAIRGTTPQGHRLFGFGLEEADGVICEVRACPCCTSAGSWMRELQAKCRALNKPLVFVSPLHGLDNRGFQVLEVSKYPRFLEPGQPGQGNQEFGSVEEWNSEFKQIYLQAVEQLGANAVAA